MNGMTGPRLRFVRPDGREAATLTAAPTLAPSPALQPGRRGLVLHAAWVPSGSLYERSLALWAEVESPPAVRHHRHVTTAAADTSRVRPHPYAAKHHELFGALERLWKTSRPGVRPRTSRRQTKQVLFLPAAGTRPLPSAELVRAGWAPDPALDGIDTGKALIALWRVDALYLDPEAAGTLLAGLPHHSGAEAAASSPHTSPEDRPEPRMLLGADLRLWSAGAKFALDLLVRQRYLPGANEVPQPDYYRGYGGYGGYEPQVPITTVWYASFSDPADRARFDALADAMPDLCRAGVPAEAQEPSPDVVPAARILLEDFTHIIINARVAHWIHQDSLILSAGGSPPSPYSAYYGYGYDYGFGRSSLTQRWLAALSRPDSAIYLPSAEARTLLDGLHRWHAGLAGAGAAPFRLCFRLSPPSNDADDEAELAEADQDLAAVLAADAQPNVSNEHDEQDGHAPTAAAPEAGTPTRMPRLVVESAGATAGDTLPTGGSAALDDSTPEMPEALWRLDYLLQARDDPSLLVPLDDVWRQRGSVARFLERRFERPHELVLTSLGQAARLFAPIDQSLREAHPVGCDLSGAEAYGFLREAVPLLEEAGFGVLVPGWWKRAAPRPSVRLRLKGGRKTSSGLMGLDAVVSYDWKLALGDQEFTREELERLAALKEPLVRLRGQWVELRPDQVDAALRFVREHPSGRMSLGEALRASLTGEVNDGEVDVEEVRADEWIGDLLGRLRGGESFAEVPQPEGLHGTLRPYQLRGLGWLAFLARFGLGACLADDMGLGKTVQLLALLARAKDAGQLSKPVLLVCPTSVVGNWRHETARFTPDLRVLVHHGADRVGRSAAESFAAEVAGHDLVVTTYSLLPRDEQTLATADWGAVVLDEAQNIKNPEAKQSRVARNLKAPVRVALTGTPVENRLTELWSIMDFLNPGYLGSNKRFHEHFAYPIEKLQDKQATARLQALVRPFVLRRLKTDPTVISDLPDKLEMKEYCPLTREQITLYEAVVRDGLRQIEVAEGDMQRRGIVLAMLSKLKQVCNHPAHFLGDESALEGRSGKLARLEELIEELLDEGDRALIFTQFTAMGDRLQPYLRERFGTEVLYLHGAVPQQQRERLVARFQSDDGPPLFLLSLKAGGTGLNLTRANHVIHFDRWWNPAVENQATDRAFRIGQTRNVQVRKFVCTGTLEERIDQMIEQKRELAEKVIGTGEGWITEMSTDELRDLFTLRADALAD